MFQGTMIEELFEIVERAEEHASHTFEAKPELNSDVMYPVFLAEVANVNPGWLGVA